MGFMIALTDLTNLMFSVNQTVTHAGINFYKYYITFLNKV